MAPTTSIWVTLITASSLGGLFAGLFTILGIMITQHYAKRRERTAWAREDAARSYEYRREAYVDFTKEFYRWHREFVIEEGDVDRVDPDYYPALLYCLAEIRIFGTKKAAQLADKAINSLFDDDIPKAEDVLAPLWSEIHRDLSIPDSAQDRTALHH
jgi:hypothetical protein